MKDLCVTPLFSSDVRARQGPDRQFEAKRLSLCHIDGFRARTMPFPNRVPSRICSADPGKKRAGRQSIQVHTKARNRLALYILSTEKSAKPSPGREGHVSSLDRAEVFVSWQATA
ncbi:hypothetical protein ACSS6W_002038 [Trichoderma asperelloides]